MSTIQTLVVKLIGDNAALHASLKESEAMTKTVGDAMGRTLGIGIAAGTAAAVAGIGALTAAVKIGMTEAMQMEDETAQLEARLKSTGGMAGWTAKEALSLADALQKRTKFSDDQTLAAQNLLLTFTRVGRDVFPDVIVAAQDMATAMKTDLLSATLMLGKAFQDPEQGLTALQRAGVRMTDTQKELIKTLMATGRVAEAQKMILTELRTEFGGAAVAAGQTFGGQLAIIKNQLLDLAEVFGTALIPVLKDVATDLKAAFADPAIKAAIEDLSKGVAKFATDSITNIKGMKDELSGFAAVVQTNIPNIITAAELMAATFLASKLLLINLSSHTLLALVLQVNSVTSAVYLLQVALAGVGTALAALAPLAVVAGVIFAGMKVAEEAARNASATARIGAATTGAGASAPGMAELIAERDILLGATKSTAEATTSLGGMVDDLAIDFSKLPPDVVDTTVQLETLAARAEALSSAFITSETTTSNWVQGRQKDDAAVTASALAAAAALDKLASAAWGEAQVKNAATMAQIAYNQAATAGALGIAGGAKYGATSFSTPVVAPAVVSFMSLLDKANEERSELLQQIADATVWVAAHPGDVLARDILKDLTDRANGIKTGVDKLGGPSLAESLPKAFPDLASATAWISAFKAEQGRAPTGVDVRDLMAGRAYAAGKGLSEIPLEDWQSRYYKGGFEGEDVTGLDAIFGPAGTMTAKLDADRTALAAENKALLDAFLDLPNQTLTVKIEGKRVTDP